MIRTQPRVIVCDIEGCITQGGGDPTPWHTPLIGKLSAVVDRMKAISDAPILVFCSGRQVPYGIAVAQATHALYDSKLGYSILENGCALTNPVWRQTLWYPRLTPQIKKNTFELKEQILRPWLETEIAGVFEEGKVVCISMNLTLQSKTLGIDSIEMLFQLVEAKLKAAGANGFVVSHSASAVDIAPAGIDKGIGLEWYADLTGLNFSEMAGIGDSQGDKPLLDRVAWPCGPANASSWVKSIDGVWIAPGETVEGVIQIIEHFVPELRG